MLQYLYFILNKIGYVRRILVLIQNVVVRATNVDVLRSAYIMLRDANWTADLKVTLNWDDLQLKITIVVVVIYCEVVMDICQ